METNRIRPRTGVFFVLALASLLQAQGISDWGENTDPWASPKQQGWIADSLFMGATFLRDTAKDFRVWFYFNEAGCIGNLHLMVPGGASDGGDTAVYLFTNKVARGTMVDFMSPQYSWVNDYIGHMDTIFFRYQVFSGFCGKNPRYTGPNRAPGDLNENGDPWTNSDRFWSPDSVGDLVRSPDGTTYPIYRRWCAAGWIRDDALNARTDTVEFGFEDLMPGDADYDDIIFHVTGVFLIRPAVVSNIQLDAVPAVSEIHAGDTVKYTATVLVDSTDSLGNHYHNIPDLVRSNRVTWSLVGDSAASIGGLLLDGPGPRRSNVFRGLRAYKTYTIMATIIDDISGQIVTSTASVTVIPDDPASLVIEGAPDTLSGLDKNVPNPVNTLTLPSAAVADTVYAILRDAYGNLVSPCTTTDWNVISGPAIVTTTAGRSAMGEGIVLKVGPAGNGQITAHDRTEAALSFTDTLAVLVDPASYEQLRFVVGTGGQKRVISQLDIDMNSDTLLYAEARRSDRLGGDANDGWVALNVGWSLSTGLTSTVPPPSSSNQWNFAPADTGAGSITIQFGSLSRVLPITVNSSGPDHAALYARPGAPGTANSPYFGPSQFTYSRRAGDPMPLVMKVFDAYNVWLPQYESDPALSARISWEARNATTGTPLTTAMGEFSVVSGHETAFTGKRSNLSVLLIATFNNGGLVCRDTVRMSIAAGPVDHLVIESTPDSLQSPNQDNRLGQIEMPNTSTDISVYALLRDFYGNFVAHADSTAWDSRNAVVATAAMGSNPALGEGLITRVATTNNQTWVVAQRGGLLDSVQVIINSITYDAVQIYALDGGVKAITNLVIRTDQDTTLYARGKRSDNGQWVDVPVAWSSSGLTLSPVAPAGSPSWSFEPGATGTGRIIARRSGTSGTVADTVQVTVNPGLPSKLLIYAVNGTQPLPSNEITGTLVAGRDTVLVARLFDHLDIPLGPAAQFTWTTERISGNAPSGALAIRANDTAAFSSTAAYKVIDIRVTYPTGSAPLSSVVRFRVMPDTAAHLYLEPSPTPAGIKLNQSDELTATEIQAADTITYVYAVLRDRFGNFVSASTATDWSALDTSIVDAFDGVTSAGEGVIVRRGRDGTTIVVAQNSTKPFLIDSIAVTITIAYDSLRIVIDNGTPASIDSLVMRTDQDTSLFVQGKRSDNGRWEYVQAKWLTSAGLELSPSAPLASSIFSFQPADTGTGMIMVSLGTSMPDTITVTFQPGLPCRIALYAAIGAPGGTNAALAPSNQPVAVQAGITDTLVAKVFDCNGVWLDWYETSTTFFTWSMEEIIGTPPTGTLTASDGSLAQFLPYRAQNRAYVIVSFTDQGRTFRDSVQYAVSAGLADHLVLESSQNPDVSPFADNPLDTITMTKNMDFSRVYAIVRDRYENWVGYSTANIWSSVDTGIVSAEDGNSVIGEGVITRTLDRNSTGMTEVIVVSRDNSDLTDTVAVSLLNISYDSLRIVVVHPDTAAIGNLVMSTNDDTTLIAIGRRSDSGNWEPVQVQWHTSDSVKVAPSAPELAQLWRFSPTVPTNSGLVWITTDDTATVNDSVSVQFIRGAPLKATIEILTPPGEMIAGQPIKAVVRIENRDGLVPDEWCFSNDSAAMYRDRLGNGGLAYVPTVTANTVTDTLNVNNTTIHSIDQCFVNGVDTVEFVIYYAPIDSTHLISLVVGSITAHTNEFTVLPDTASRVVLVDRRDGTPLGDTLVLDFPDDAILIEVRGYDTFGNPTGTEQSLWETTGGIPPASPRVGASVYYTVSSAQDNATGTLRVTSLQTGTALKDSVVIRINGFYPDVTSAVTRDASGNGYLDRIEFTFSKWVDLDDSWLDGFAIANGDAGIAVDSVGYGPDSATVYVYLHEDTVTTSGGRAEPQTSWTPTITLNLFGGQLTNQIVAQDGAGPVIWEVTKKMESATDRSSDHVTITFSEPILTDNTNPSLGYKPQDLFTIWEKDPINGEFVPVVGLLDNIDQLFNVIDASTVEFVMENGLDLKTRNYITINTASGIITDNAVASGSYNAPGTNNRKASVVLITPPPEAAFIYPNPAQPDLTNQKYPPGSFSFTHEEQARRWAKDGQGVVLSFTLPQPAPGERIRGHIKIYDVSGNLVATDDTDDLLHKFTDGFSAYDVDIFWNGTNTFGMPASPGIYRYIIYLDYQIDDTNDIRMYGNIGIRH